MQVVKACRTPITRCSTAARLSTKKNSCCYIIRGNISFSSRQRYARSLSIVHWLMAGGVLSCFGLIEIKKRQPKGSKLIGPLMFYHKSIGALLMGFIAARVGLRFVTKIPKPLEAPNWMITSSKLSHAVLCMCLYYALHI